jgi:hypothetical protein
VAFRIAQASKDVDDPSVVGHGDDAEQDLRQRAFGQDPTEEVRLRSSASAASRLRRDGYGETAFA